MMTAEKRYSLKEAEELLDVRLYTMAEAQELLRVSRRQLYYMRDRGEIEVVKLGQKAARVTGRSLRTLADRLKRKGAPNDEPSGAPAGKSAA
jgi:hypothetical protein